MLLYEEEMTPHTFTAGQRIYLVFKGLVDRLIALISLIVLAIPFLIIGIIIKIDSHGPVFFVQERVGKNGNLFKCVKFRSMYKRANHNRATNSYSGMGSDVTRVGTFLRTSSIDELPQLFNVLKGDMYLISYRPVISNNDEMPLHQARRKFRLYKSLKPGITGWAQVHGRDNLTDPELKAKYDGYYLKHLSPVLDLKILFMTIGKVLCRNDIRDGKKA